MDKQQGQGQEQGQGQGQGQYLAQAELPLSSSMFPAIGIFPPLATRAGSLGLSSPSLSSSLSSLSLPKLLPLGQFQVIPDRLPSASLSSLSSSSSMKGFFLSHIEGTSPSPKSLERISAKKTESDESNDTDSVAADVLTGLKTGKSDSAVEDDFQ